MVATAAEAEYLYLADEHGKACIAFFESAVVQCSCYC